MTAITLEQLEALADRIESEDAAERLRLRRLIAAYARILAIREPERFPRKPREHSDEDGHCDNSYPPSVEYKDHTGPHLLKVEGWETQDIPTSGGYYHDWRRVTTDPGLYITRDGELLGASETGTGRYGQFAAYPGNCNVMCEIEWVPLLLSDVPLERLRQAEEVLRIRAFPLVAAATAL